MSKEISGEGLLGALTRWMRRLYTESRRESNEAFKHCSVGAGLLVTERTDYWKYIEKSKTL